MKPQDTMSGGAATDAPNLPPVQLADLPPMPEAPQVGGVCKFKKITFKVSVILTYVALGLMALAYGSTFVIESL